MKLHRHLLGAVLLCATGAGWAGGNGVNLATTSGTGSIWVSENVLDALSGRRLEDIPPNPGLVERIRRLTGARELAGGSWLSPPLRMPDQSLVAITVDVNGKITQVERLGSAPN